MSSLSLGRSFTLPMRTLLRTTAKRTKPTTSSILLQCQRVKARAFHKQRPSYQRHDPWAEAQRQRSNGYRQSYGDPRHNAKPLFTAETLRSPGFKMVAIGGSGAAIIFYFANQETVPVSGRRRFNYYSAEAAESQGLQAYQQIIQQEGRQGKILPEWDPRVRQVKRVLTKLIEGGGLGDGGSAPGSGWEVQVIEDPGTQNAFVLPGGKVFVYSGILPICRDDNGLAAVLGHEIAHNIAQHSAERMSSALPITMLSYVFAVLDSMGWTLGLGQILGSMALDFGVMRPASRQQESEADYIGLLLMAQSCYDPSAAVGLWQRMEKASQGNPPEWMSTHPSNENRILRIQEWLPKAEEKSQESGCSITQGYAQGFQKAVGLSGSRDPFSYFQRR